MAQIVIVVEDAYGPNGDEGVNIEIKSSNPAMPIKDGTLDFEAATKSQNLAFGMIVDTVGAVQANLLIETKEEP